MSYLRLEELVDFSLSQKKKYPIILTIYVHIISPPGNFIFSN